MKDIELRLADQPGSLAAMALTLGEAGISGSYSMAPIASSRSR